MSPRLEIIVFRIIERTGRMQPGASGWVDRSSSENDG